MSDDYGDDVFRRSDNYRTVTGSVIATLSLGAFSAVLRRRNISIAS